MENHLFNLNNTDITTIENTTQQHAIHALETGKVLFLPNYSFNHQNVEPLLSENLLDGKHKNISFDYLYQKLKGFNSELDQATKSLLHNFMHCFAEFSQSLIHAVLPQYKNHLLWGRTSYRPAQIKGRVSSKRKDDTRIHVDSFASTPVNGLRILRVFCNINPYQEPRVWHLGEPFSHVLQHFSSKVSPYNSKLAKFLHFIKITKTLRSAYDHYQLQLHDRMKLDDHYQQHVNKICFEFPAKSTWIVFTDHTSHAALSGQFLLEQTFYLPVAAMKNPELSPLKNWEKEKMFTHSEAHHSGQCEKIS